ncbi:MAG: hypothetical protein GYB64_12480 [Chloroflexi bacterium]|nr:hypothetical protein [Chloroflexota bacterium]
MRPLARTAALIAVAAGVLGATADVVMLAAPGFARDPAAAQLLVSVPRITAGFLLGVTAIPVYMVGYWAVYDVLKPARYTGLLLGLSLFGIVQGTTFHGLAGSAAYLIQTQQPADPMAFVLPYLPIMLPPFVVLHLILGVGTILLVLIRQQEGVDLPLWLVLISPGIGTAALYAIGLVIAPLGDYLLPAAMNLAHAAFFAAFVTRAQTG